MVGGASGENVRVALPLVVKKKKFAPNLANPCGPNLVNWQND
jgi:hypothetical protein